MEILRKNMNNTLILHSSLDGIMSAYHSWDIGITI